MPFNAADLVTVKGDVNLTQVQIYPGMGGQHGGARFNMVITATDRGFTVGYF